MDRKTARKRLEEERERLQAIREGLRTDLSGPEAGGQTPREALSELSAQDQHPADLGTETFEQEKDRSILESVDAQLADIEHALGRIDDGTYGRCEACGRPIGDERLEAMPAARFCVEDQARVEREARAS